MEPKEYIHPIDIKILRAEQKIIAKKVSLVDVSMPPHIVAGFDLAFTEEKTICAAIVLEFPTLKKIEEQFVVIPTTFPYIPTLLSFREMPAILAVYKKLGHKPDLIMIDGQGILHPFRAGIASHVGVTLDLPTIGVAKSRLCGEERGDKIFVEGELRGEKVHTKKGCQPIYVSPGHKISLEKAKKHVLHCVTRYKLPEPTRLADRLSKELKVKKKTLEE